MQSSLFAIKRSHLANRVEPIYTLYTLNGIHDGHEGDDPHRLAIAEAGERGTLVSLGAPGRPIPGPGLHKMRRAAWPRNSQHGDVAGRRRASCPSVVAGRGASCADPAIGSPARSLWHGGRVRGEHAVIPMAIPARRRDEGRQPVEELHGCEAGASDVRVSVTNSYRSHTRIPPLTSPEKARR